MSMSNEPPDVRLLLVPAGAALNVMSRMESVRPRQVVGDAVAPVMYRTDAGQGRESRTVFVSC